MFYLVRYQWLSKKSLASIYGKIKNIIYPTPQSYEVGDNFSRQGLCLLSGAYSLCADWLVAILSFT